MTCWKRKEEAMAVIKAKDFEDLVKRVNPFGIRDEKGTAMTFNDYGKCYFFVLCFLYEKYPKGFIDVPLFLHELMGNTLNDARRIAKKLPFITTENEIFLCAWIDKVSKPKQQAEMLMRALHTLSDTKFSTDFYNWAWDEFCKLNKIEQI